MKVTAITRLKHTALLEAAEDFGGVPKLAKHLGVSSSVVYSWVSMRSVPPREIFATVTVTRRHKDAWPPERLEQLEVDLMQVTGQTTEQLFPDAYRDAVVAGIPRVRKEIREVEHSRLLEYAQKTTQRLQYKNPGEEMDRCQILAKCREPLTDRESRLITMRYEEQMTYSECGGELGVCRERVREIECKALNKMRRQAERMDL